MTSRTRTHRQLNFSYFHIVAAAIAILAAVAVPRFIATAGSTRSGAADEAAIAAAFREIRKAETDYRSRNGEFTDLLNLRNAGFIRDHITSVDELNFRFSVQADDGSHYFVTASPTVATSGSHYFYTDEEGRNFESYTAQSAANADSSGQPPDGYVSTGG